MQAFIPRVLLDLIPWFVVSNGLQPRYHDQ